MSSNGGPRKGSDEPTSFGLQPPNPPVAVPHPGNPYAAPTQVVAPRARRRTYGNRAPVGSSRGATG